MKKVLVVDDHKQNPYLLATLLGGHGFEVSEADDGASALDVARRDPPDLIISDLLMPTMDGYTLLREWKADPTLAGAPFIVYTATYTQSEDERLAHDLGADAFLVKPTEPDEFLKRVQAVLAKPADLRAKPRQPVASNAEVERRYSQTLVRKLEQRSAELARRVGELQIAKSQIQRLNRLYSALSAINQLIAHAPSRSALLQGVCRILVDRGGFALTWIGMISQDGKNIERVALEGGHVEMFERFGPIQVEKPYRSPVEIAMGEDRVFLSNDISTDEKLADIWPIIREYELRSTASCPLHIDNKAVGAIGLYAREPDFFDESLVGLIKEVGVDVSYALENYRRDELRAQAESNLKSAEEFNRLAQRVIEASPTGVMITSARSSDNPILYVNSAFERITGYTREEVTGRDPRFLTGDDHDQHDLIDIREAVAKRREGEAILRNYRKDGALFWNELTIAPVVNEDGRPTHFVGVINDITDRKQYEEQLERQYSQDSLTGLASRNLLRDRVEQAIAAARHARQGVALLFVDLDLFKRINDSLGRTAGDKVLTEVASRLSRGIDLRDTVARMSSDEFVILISDVVDEGDLAALASTVLGAFDDPIDISGRTINITACVGISVYPANGDDFDTLLRNADIAMYRAKQLGVSRFQFYTEDMNASALERVDMESRLRRAVEDRKMTLYYQPVVDLSNNRVIGAEALLRWPDGDRLIAPDEFIPMAEETGLIIPLGQWVIEQAVTQASQWRRKGLELRMAINLSARQFRDPQLKATIQNVLELFDMPAEWLSLEITESVVMDNAEEAARILSELQALGLGISIDDFGTGYSSLAYLKRFPIDQFKIDRSFIQDLDEQNESAAIVMSIIRLARSLDLATVAEGVETELHRDYLARAGCELAQGYFYSRPLPADEFTRWLDERKDQ